MAFCATCGAAVEGQFCAKCGSRAGAAPSAAARPGVQQSEGLAENVLRRSVTYLAWSPGFCS